MDHSKENPRHWDQIESRVELEQKAGDHRYHRVFGVQTDSTSPSTKLSRFHSAVSYKCCYLLQKLTK